MSVDKQDYIWVQDLKQDHRFPSGKGAQCPLPKVPAEKSGTSPKSLVGLRSAVKQNKWTVIVKTERDAVRTSHLGPPKIRQASRLYSDRLESNFTLPLFEDACFKFGFLQGNSKSVKRNLVFWWSLKTDTPRRLDGIEFTGLKARTVAVPTQRLTSAELMK